MFTYCVFDRFSPKRSSYKREKNAIVFYTTWSVRHQNWRAVIEEFQLKLHNANVVFKLGALVIGGMVATNYVYINL